jgi:hypothetical protein
VVGGSSGSLPRRGVPSRTLGLAKAVPRRKKVPVYREYVGIDLHRRRSVIVRKNRAGLVLSKCHIANDALALADAVFAGEDPHPEVVIEASSAGIGWPTCCPRAGRRCIWCIRWGTTGGTDG